MSYWLFRRRNSIMAAAYLSATAEVHSAMLRSRFACSTSRGRKGCVGEAYAAMLHPFVKWGARRVQPAVSLT